MVDNVAITAGTGTTVATDDAGGAQYQRIKLTDGTPDSTEYIPGTTNRGLKVNPGQIKRISVTPVITLTAYTAKDALGGKLTFANAAAFSGGGITLLQAVVIDNDQERAPLDLVLFDRDFTASTDNAIFAPSDADLLNLVAVVPIIDYADFSNNSVGFAQGSWPLALNGTSLFGQLLTRGQPTYAAVNDITVALTLRQE